LKGPKHENFGYEFFNSIKVLDSDPTKIRCNFKFHALAHSSVEPKVLNNIRTIDTEHKDLRLPLGYFRLPVIL
jgi:hypothetical protein